MPIDVATSSATAGTGKGGQNSCDSAVHLPCRSTQDSAKGAGRVGSSMWPPSLASPGPSSVAVRDSVNPAALLSGL